ncbi:MAG: ABC-F family ATP-binding cassette domain-containing protein [Kiritimatiellia bacterium]|jgi:ATP-binding cassette subfamily F protein 3|nr:ABC-F family ATP-binding cassette domain-containing protein [Kiritimatiellia bacterium]
MIEFRNISMHFGTQDVLNEIALQVNKGERVGIVGPNGAGKTTLFSLITGDILPYRGDVLMPKNQRIGYVRQQLGSYGEDCTLLDFACKAIPELSDIEHKIGEIEKKLHFASGPERDRMLMTLGDLQGRFEHLGGYDMHNRAEAALCGLGFSVSDFKRSFPTFSGGWQKRAELARTLIGDPDVLLLDEPSNYLDLPAVEWLQRYLRDFHGTLMLISHDRFLLRSLTFVTVEIGNGHVTRYEGGYDYYATERITRRDNAVAAKKNQDRKREQMERFIDKFRAKNTKASQVQSKIKALDRLEDVEMPVLVSQLPPIRVAQPPRCGAEVMRLEDVGLAYDGETWVLRHVDVRISRGDKAALVGYNGMGKTTLLRVMSGRYSPSEGQRVLGHKVEVGYQSQESAETMPATKSVFDTVHNAATEMSGSEVRSILGSFGFSGDDVFKRCEVLSGGEKIRLAFARLFAARPNLLLLDEPTTHLDMHGREMLENALQKYQGTICLVSHDVDFVRRIATSIIEISGSGVSYFNVDYDYYREKFGGLDSGEQAPPAGEDGSAAPSKKVLRQQRATERQERTRATKQLKRRVRHAENTIESLESEMIRLVEELGERSPGTDFEDLNRRLKTVQAEIEQHTTEWEESAALLEDMEKNGK